MEILKLPLFTQILSTLTNSLKSVIKYSECYLKYENMKCEWFIQIGCKYLNSFFFTKVCTDNNVNDDKNVIEKVSFLIRWKSWGKKQVKVGLLKPAHLEGMILFEAR